MLAATNDQLSSVHDRTTTSTCSAKRPNRVLASLKSKPFSRCSRSYHPAPMPTSTRPPETWSTVSAWRASTLGCRKVAGDTIVPMRIRVVTTASAASVAQASSAPAIGRTIAE